MGFREDWRAILDEVARSLDRLSQEQIESFCSLVAGARGVFVTGEGRSGFVGRCFAMRLMHLGLTAHFVGDTTTPSLGKGDVLVAISGTGETPVTVTLARLAAQAGGQVVTITAAEHTSLGACSDLTVLIPAGVGGASVQYGRSLFEQSALILLDAIALDLQRRLGRTAEEMDRNHTNLE